MPKKRSLSEFMARELLYDYISGRLDRESISAVEEAMQETPEVRDDLKAMKEGLKYCEGLGQSRLSEPLFSMLDQPPKSFVDYLRSWKEVRPAVRHTVESLLVAMVVAAIVISIPRQYFPWNKTTSYTVIEVPRDERQSNVEVAAGVSTTLAVDASGTTLVYYGPPTTLKTASASAVTTTLASVAVVAAQPKVEPKPVPAPTPAATPAQTAQVPKTRGVIFRVYMSSNKVDEITPQFVEKILALNGKKAGEVGLGWRRKQGSYFHFTLPESNLEALQTFLQTFGAVRIVKEPHPRVMPEGQIRLILWLETTSKDKNNDASEEPAEGN